jgi:hypothetical protein
MNSPSTPPPSGDAALDAALRTLRDVEAPVATVRDAHIANALQHIVAPISASEPAHNVVSLDSRRRRRIVAALGSVAAAGLFAVGMGVGRVSAPASSTLSAQAEPVESVPVKNAVIEQSVTDPLSCVTDPTAKTYVLPGNRDLPAQWVVALHMVDGVKTVTVFNATNCAVEWQLPAGE